MEESKTLKVAALQLNSLWEQSERNIAHATALIEAVDAELVILPEMFATGFSMNSERIAQTDNGAIVSAITRIAIACRKAIIFSAAISDHQKIYNRLYFIHPTGRIERYDKRHLFRMAGEHHHYAAGADRLIVDYKGWRICPLVCYDLRFPVFSRGADAYDLLIYIASWPSARSYAWSTLLRARAIENQTFCVGVNRVGDDPKNHYSGNSAIVDYLGQPIIEAKPNAEPNAETNDDANVEPNEKPNDEQILIAELSLADLREYRNAFPAYKDADNFELLP